MMGMELPDPRKFIFDSKASNACLHPIINIIIYTNEQQANKQTNEDKEKEIERR